jgi:AcrR family transcriptional regulator
MRAAETDGRGRYDRGATASERARTARAAITSAVIRLLRASRAVPSVDDVCGLTGLGRNTFYGHFPSAQAAADQVVTDCLAQIEHTLGSAARAALTPYAEVTEFAQGWFDFCASTGDAVEVAEAAGRDRLQAALEQRLRALHAAGASAGVYRKDLGFERLVALRGATVELSLAVATGRALPATAASAFVDAMLGLCR